MGFTLEASVPVLTVLAQGLLSFFSPCVLPLVPLYVSYLAGGAQTQDENGNPVYPRGKILLNTLFFVLGISFTFFLLGLGMTALGRFFSQNRILFASAGGVIMILFGLYQLGLFGRAGGLEREHRLPFRLDKWAMNPLTALVLGFTFSFAWTPCVGPALSSVLIMASSSQTAGAGFLLIGVYTLGFVVPFLVVGLFTGAALSFFSRHRSVVRYTVKIGGVLMIVMGIMTMTGMMNGFTGYLSDSPEETTQEDPDSDIIPAPDFTLVDQYGEEHTLSDYKGKTVFLNFWMPPQCFPERLWSRVFTRRWIRWSPTPVFWRPISWARSITVWQTRCWRSFRSIRNCRISSRFWVWKSSPTRIGLRS